MLTINAMVMDAANKIVAEMPLLLALRKAATLGCREVQTAVRLALPGEIMKHAVSEGTKAVTKYHMSKSGAASARSGLTFPVAYFTNLIKNKLHTRVGKTSGVYLAATMEYLAAEILELAGNAARDMRQSRITPRHILLSVRGDAELDSLFTGIVPGGGVVPHIHRALVGNKPNWTQIEAPEKKPDETQSSPFGLAFGGATAKKAASSPVSFGGGFAGPFGGFGKGSKPLGNGGKGLGMAKKAAKSSKASYDSDDDSGSDD